MVVTGGGDAAGFIVWMVQTVKIVMLQLKTKDTDKQMDMGHGCTGIGITFNYIQSSLLIPGDSVMHYAGREGLKPCGIFKKPKWNNESLMIQSMERL